MTCLCCQARILLDEPTTGMDPGNRRGVWQVLQERKTAGVNIVLTTHSMEEADTLGDTIGIMADGKLEAFGPSLELKAKYGLGYHLHCERSTEVNLVESDQAAKITAIITGILGADHEPKLLGDIGTEVSFGLSASAPMEKFPELLNALDDKKAELGIATYGLSATTLEEVFLNLDKENKEKKRVEEEKEKEEAAKEADKKNNKKGAKVVVVGEPEGETASAVQVTPAFDPSKVAFECAPSTGQQVYGVLCQVVLLFLRNKMSFSYVVVWPVMMSLIAGWVNTLFEVTVDTIALDPALLSRDDFDMEDDGTFEQDAIATMGATYPYAWTEAPAAATTAATLLGPLAGGLSSDVTAILTASIATADGPFLPGAYSLTATAADFQTILYYNQSVAYSARVAVEQLYAGLASGSTPAAGIKVSYIQLPNSLMQNSFSVGGVQYLTASAFALLAPFYTEEMVRLRISRVKDMMLMTGLSRPVFWGSYFISHWTLMMFSWLMSMFCMLVWGMDGVTENSWFAYFILFAAFGCGNIWWGYIASFFVNSIEVAQEVSHLHIILIILTQSSHHPHLPHTPHLILSQAVAEMNNLLVLIPWCAPSPPPPSSPMIACSDLIHDVRTQGYPDLCHRRAIHPA